MTALAIVVLELALAIAVPALERVLAIAASIDVLHIHSHDDIVGLHIVGNMVLVHTASASVAGMALVVEQVLERVLVTVPPVHKVHIQAPAYVLFAVE